MQKISFEIKIFLYKIILDYYSEESILKNKQQ